MSLTNESYKKLIKAGLPISMKVPCYKQIMSQRNTPGVQEENSVLRAEFALAY